MRDRRQRPWTVLALGALIALVAGCGGPADRARAGGAGSLEEIAFWLRYEGGLLGAEALEARFGAAGLQSAELGVTAGELRYFLTASRYLIACADGPEPVIAYYGPLYRNVLLTRWSVGRETALRSVEVLAAPADAGDTLWVRALAQAGPERGLDQIAAELLERRRQWLSEAELCSRAAAPAQRSRLLEPIESGSDPLLLADRARYLAALNRALLEAFTLAEFEGLEYLLDGRHPELLARVRGLGTAIQLVPAWLLYRELGADAEALVIYADMAVPGRYVSLATRGPAWYPGPDGAQALALRLDLLNP